MRFKRIVSLILLTVMLVSNITVGYASGSTVPEGNNVGSGNAGPFSNGAIMVKADFYEIDILGIDKLKYETKEGVTGLNFASVSERGAFERGNKNQVMDPVNYSGTGVDSKALAQIYAFGNYGYKPAYFLMDKGVYTTSATGHYFISPLSMTGTTNAPYKSANSIISATNIYMQELLQVTNNGKSWNSKEIADKINDLWKRYVDPTTGDFSSTSPGVRYRREFASMFNLDNGVVTFVDASEYIGTFMNTQLAVGSRPTGTSFTIETDNQKAHLQNLFMASLALVLANPADGTTISGTTIPKGSSYKGTTILNNLSRWARDGGNKDDNNYHFAIRLESYASRGMAAGSNRFDRWDMSIWNSTIQSDRFKIAITPRFNSGITSFDYYGYGQDYTQANSQTLFAMSTQTVIDAHRAVGLSIKNNPADAPPNWLYSSGQSIFQNATINGQGGIRYATNTYNFRGMLEFKSPAYMNGVGTMNTGFAYIAPTGPNSSPLPDTARPNFKLDSVVFSDINEVAKGDKASVTSYTGFKFPPMLSPETVTSLNLNIPENTWNNPNSELNALLKLIDRAKDSTQIASGSTNSLLPVELTVNRTIVNGKGNTDGKIFDDNMASSTIIAGCNHNFRIENDNGNSAVVKFNIIPSSGQCNYKEYKVQSPRLTSQGKTGEDSYVIINNCAVATLFQDASSRIKFKDDKIDITDTPGGITTIHYDFSYVIRTPIFKPNLNAYGDAQTDLMANVGTYVGKGYSKLPEGGSLYPNTDWTTGRIMSNTIRRSIQFVRQAEKPSYSNFGYELKNPHYAEIKQGSPTNEQFEAMAGVPTTRNLYMSVSGTDFRVDFDARPTPKQNPASTRTYTYTVNVNNCWETNPPCTGSCPGPVYNAQGALTHAYHPPQACGAPSCGNHPTNQHHPDSHVWTYTVNIPINPFTYFDMETSEVWRLNSWGLNGGNGFLTSPNPTYTMGTQFWGYNMQDYSSGNGRLIFSEAMASNTQGLNAKFGNNSRTFTVSDGLRTTLRTEALSLVNGAKNSEPAFKAMAISDYIVLKTSEGYQVPYFFSQETSNSVAPSTAPNFTTEGGTVTTSQQLNWPKQLTIDELWWNNNKKTEAATPKNGWHNASITYAGYNGNYGSLSTKYTNDTHNSFINNTNPLEVELQKYGLTLSQTYPNQKRDGTGTTTFGKNAGNTDHIKTGIDIIDTTPNGEYNTGNAWVQYNRVMFYQSNVDRGNTSSITGKFPMTSNGIWRNNNVPYYKEAEKVNNIVVHNPVSAEYAIVVSNDSKYDTRTNAKLLQGGDPPGLLGGICPIVGCQFSTLTCTHNLTPHIASCYVNVEDVKIHVGGNNTHVHDANCNIHNHATSGCLVKKAYCSHDCHPPSGWGCSPHSSIPGACYSGCTWAHCTSPVGPVDQWSCGITQTCTNIPNTHVCTAACYSTYKQVLSCTNPHHYAPGEPTDITNPKFHYPLGDSRCWTRCNDNDRHGVPASVTLPNGTTASLGGTFINLDREFSIYYPFVGDFAESPSLSGVSDTTPIRGKGYTNSMNTREWTSHRWVRFPVNVIDPAGNMRLAWTQIDLNDFSATAETFTFYSVLANNEMSKSEVKFTSSAINAPVSDHSIYFDDSSGVTNRDRTDWKYAAKHTANKFQYIDVVGYIGALAINDTGDYRFSNLFKQSKGDGSWLIQNLVPEVHLNRPNFIVTDRITSRLDTMSIGTQWLDTYGKMFNTEGGKSGGTGNTKAPLVMPLVPRYNNIPSLRNQPMRPGYQLYMDTETVGNYYGETVHEDTGQFLDNQMQSKMQIRPQYYSLNMDTGVYTPVDVYYGVNNVYMMVNDFKFGNTGDDAVGVQDYYYYLDWLNESSRRNFTNAENEATRDAMQFRATNIYNNSNFRLRQPNVERDIIGSANVLFLNDLNRTFIGSSLTYGVNKNPGNFLPEAKYNEQSQRWHFTVGLPSSAVFVESGKPCTEANIRALQTNNRVIICTLDIKVQGDVWTLQYDGRGINNTGFQVVDGGPTFQPPRFDSNGNPTTNPSLDVTSMNPIIVVYSSSKTSKDDVTSKGTQ